MFVGPNTLPLKQYIGKFQSWNNLKVPNSIGLLWWINCFQCFTTVFTTGPPTELGHSARPGLVTKPSYQTPSWPVTWPDCFLCLGLGARTRWRKSGTIPTFPKTPLLPSNNTLYFSSLAAEDVFPHHRAQSQRNSCVLTAGTADMLISWSKLDISQCLLDHRSAQSLFGFLVYCWFTMA